MLIGDTSKIELKFGCVGFCGEGKTGAPGEKPLGARTRTNNQLNPHMTPGPGVEPRPHWWEASALTTAPSLLPQRSVRVLNIKETRKTKGGLISGRAYNPMHFFCLQVDGPGVGEGGGLISGSLRYVSTT